MIKKIVILLTISFLNAAYAQAQANQKANTQLDLAIEKMSGVAYENVYVGNNKISELKWDIQSVEMLKFGIEQKIPSFAILPRSKFRISYANAINNGSQNAQMVDTDWLKSGTNGNVDPANWSHRSWHKIQLTKAYSFDSNWSFSPNILTDEKFFEGLSFGFGYKRDYFKWKDSSHNYIYSTAPNGSGFRDDIGLANGNSITYSQQYDIPYLSTEYQQAFFDDKFFVTIYGALSNLVKANDFDQHHSKNINYSGKFNNGKYQNYGFKISYKIFNPLNIGFGYDLSEISEFKGNVKTQNLSTNQTTFRKNGASISNKISKYSAFLQLQF